MFDISEVISTKGGMPETEIYRWKYFVFYINSTGMSTIASNTDDRFIYGSGNVYPSKYLASSLYGSEFWDQLFKPAAVFRTSHLKYPWPLSRFYLYCYPLSVFRLQYEMQLPWSKRKWKVESIS